MTPGTEPTWQGGRIPSLNGIRAIAIGVVFLAHSGLQHLLPGGLGVTIFFVLSGYLITTLLCVEFERCGRIDFRAFYSRRFLRLMPPLYIAIAFAGVLSALSIIEGGFTVGGLLSMVFYVGNYYIIAGDFHGIPAGIGPVWSLAVEEHFYLLYPPLAAALLHAGSRKLAVVALGSLSFVILCWRGWLATHGGSQAYIEMASDTRADAILVGCLMAFAYNPRRIARPAISRGKALAICSGCLLVLAGTLAWRNEFFRQVFRYSIQSLAIAPLLYFSIDRGKDSWFRWLDSRPMVYLGTISYSVYLIHQIILLMIQRHWPELGWLPTLIATALITWLIADLLRRLVEEPCARLRARMHDEHGPASVPSPSFDGAGTSP